MERVLEVEEARGLMLTPDQVKEALEPVIERTPAPSRKGRFINIDRMYQHRVRPTVFRFITRFPDLVDTSWQRFLERKIREAFDFTGVPIKLEFMNRRQERDRK
jgi:GTP-binding protein